MTDVATLAFKVDDSGLKDGARSLDRVTDAAGRAQTASGALMARVDQMGASMVSAGKAATLFLTTPLLAAGGAAAKLAIDAAETASKFDVVFRGSVDRSREALEAMTATVPLTRSEMEAMAAGIQDMLVPMGVARDEAAGMSVGMIQLAADMGSFNNVGTEQVLMDIQSALAGSAEPMRKYGVDTRMTRLEQIALRDGLIGVGEEMTTTAQATATLTAIMEDSSDAHGDAARTVESASNQLRLMRRDVVQLFEDLGQNLIPVIREFVPIIRDWISQFAALTAEHQGLILVVGGVAAALGPMIVALGLTVQAGAALIPVLATVKGLVFSMTGLFAGIGLAIGAAAIAIERQFVPGMEDVGATAQVINVLQRAFVVLSGIIKGVAELAVSLGSTVLGAFRVIIAPIEGLVTQGSAAIQALINRDFAAAKEAAIGVGQAITDANLAGQAQIEAGVAGMKDAITSNVTETMDEVTRLRNNLLGIGDDAEQAGRDGAAGIDLFGGALGRGVAIMEAFVLRADSAAESVGSVGTQAEKTALAVAEFEQKLGDQVRALREQKIEIEGGTRAVLEYELAQLKMAGASDEAIDRLQGMIDEVVTAEANIESLTRSTDSYGGSMDKLNSDMDSHIAMWEQYQAEVEMAAWHTEQMQRIAENSLAGVSSAFSAFMTGEISSFGDFVGEINTVLQQGLTDSVNQVMSKAMAGGSLGGSDFATLGLGALGGLGGMIGGRTGGAISGAAGGAQMGMAFGPWGAVIGGIVGGVAGLLGAEKDPILQTAGANTFTRSNEEARRRGDVVDTALGEIFFRFRNIESGAQTALKNALTDFDGQIANILSGTGFLGEAREALKDFQSYSQDPAQVLRERFNIIAHALDDFETGLILSENGLEAQIQQMADIFDIQSMLPDLEGFNQIGDEEFLTVINNLRQGTETLGQAFQRITNAFQTYANTAASIQTEIATAGLNDFQSQLVRIQMESNNARDALNAQAQAAGLSAARAEDLAGVHELTAMRMAAVIAQMEDQARGLVESLFGTELTRLMDQVNEARAGGATDEDLTGELERIAQLEAEEAARQRALQGQQLAQLIADIEQGTGEGFSAVAERLNFDLAQLAEVLGLDQAGLIEQLEAMQIDPMALATEIQNQTGEIVGALINLPGAFSDALYGVGDSERGDSVPGMPEPGDSDGGGGGGTGGRPGGDSFGIETVSASITTSVGQTTAEVAGLRGDITEALGSISANDANVAAALNNLAAAIRQSRANEPRSDRTRARV